MDAFYVWALKVGLIAVGAIVWLVRLEGRINTGERLHLVLANDVAYIRQRIDIALNGRR